VVELNQKTPSILRIHIL